ncbi:hypothetical protein AXF19_00885 [Selenomonas sp. oral taxon 126]|uniref:glycosyltransferase n=1 Tax=Selenomonas sp. oral taxon 126 TaxID=712528 RepID=UPI00080798E1|nr:glycosyltransferase [Selenomonas sp. oral taxon 126]ANR69693.1 hypothetical protein AXF19_00885 [Selenomonas sp. oral taxon 126]
MLKILHVGEYMQGGVATYVNTILSNSSNNIEHYLLLAHGKSEKNWNIPHERIFFYSYERNLYNIWSAIKYIREFIINLNPDIVFVHSTWAGVFVRLPYLLSKRNVKIIYNAHGWAFLRDTAKPYKIVYGLIERILLSVTDCVVNVSNYEQQAALKYGLKPHKMVRIYSGVDDTWSSYTTPYSMEKGKINLLFVGRFDRPKGLDWLLEIMSDVQLSFVHLYVIGAPVVDRKMNSYKNTDRVTYLGWIPHKDLGRYYSACDAVIMPSLWEAFGLTAVEAMCNNKPVLVSDRGALPELVRDGVNGYIFSLEKENLVKLLLSLDNESLAEMGRAARDIYETEFSADVMRSNLNNLYVCVANQYEN